MIKKYENILGLATICKILNKDENNEKDLQYIIGSKECVVTNILEILINIGFVNSKSEFGKNPQVIRVDNIIVSGEFIPTTNFVLTLGKGSSLKATYIKINV